jgi:uncharacterized protein
VPKGFDTSRPLTPQLFYQYLQCPHWIWFDHYGDQSKKKELSALQQKLLERGVMHEEKYMKDQDVIEVREKNITEAAEKTLALMKKGVPRIYQGALISGRWRGRPDILEKKEGSSSFGDYHYIPIDIKSSHDIHTAQQLQLVFYALLLEDVQGLRPPKAGIINIDHKTILFDVSIGLKRLSAVLEGIYELLDGKKPDPYLTRQCSETPWFGECKRTAEEKNDIALIYNIKKPAMQALRKHKIKTVADAAWMDPDELTHIAPGLTKRELERIKRQATSLMKQEMIVKHPAKLPAATTYIYFDIEGDPFYAMEYLFGFLMEVDGKEKYTAFIAERPEDEEKMWKEFLEWIPTLPKDYLVYHYASYEKSRLTMFEKKYGGGEGLAEFKERLVDLAIVIRDSVVLPLYFYGLKDIAKHLGFTWSHSQAGGAQSIAWYEQWLETGDRKILDTIIEYNKDDVVATRFLKEWIEGIKK